MHKVFKAERRGDRVRTAYLHPDGHVTVVFERRELGKRLQYVKIAQTIGIRNASYWDRGRIVFSSAAALAAAVALPGPVYLTIYTNNETQLDLEKTSE